jgi:hypothetical protein
MSYERQKHDAQHRRVRFGFAAVLLSTLDVGADGAGGTSPTDEQQLA